MLAAAGAEVDDVAVAHAERVARFEPIFDELAQGKLISRSDLEKGIRKAAPQATMTEEQIDRMFRLADIDDSGRITLDEFMLLFEDIPDEDLSLASLAASWIGYSHAVADPELIFQLTWRRLATQHGGEEQIQLPCEILFLGGAPGAGKGTMTPYILSERGLDAQPVVMSSLLNSPVAQKIIEQGGLVSDFEVFQMLLEQLARPEQAKGCMVDGFPRTVVQVRAGRRRRGGPCGGRRLSGCKGLCDSGPPSSAASAYLSPPAPPPWGQTCSSAPPPPSRVRRPSVSAACRSRLLSALARSHCHDRRSSCCGCCTRG